VKKISPPWLKLEAVCLLPPLRSRPCREELPTEEHKNKWCNVTCPNTLRPHLVTSKIFNYQNDFPGLSRALKFDGNTGNSRRRNLWWASNIFSFTKRLERLRLWMLEERGNHADILGVFRMYRRLSLRLSLFSFNHFFTISWVATTTTRGQSAKIARCHLHLRHYFFPVAWLTDATIYHKVSSTPTLWTHSTTDWTVWGIWGWAF